MASNVDDVTTICPFEGPEKLLEIWFAPSPENVPDATTAEKGQSGLRAVERKVWEDMLDIVKCKVLSVIYGEEMDAYLLSESSLFISPHRLILKTCGTTLNLLGLPRILHIARTHANLPSVYQCFYSRKAFMFPDKQLGPHKDWTSEIEFLDNVFERGSAYTVGKMNGDHWLLYMTTPEDLLGSGSAPVTESSSLASSFIGLPDLSAKECAMEGREKEQWSIVAPGGLYSLPLLPPAEDYTIEILMTHLSARARSAFMTPDGVDPSEHAKELSNQLGITDIFPRKYTNLDAYAFSPCGYSANALIKWDEHAAIAGQHTSNGPKNIKPTPNSGEGYYTIHVTPEEGWSYASFECNVPLATRRPGARAIDSPDNIPDLGTLIRRVVKIFEPGKITMTLFVASDSGDEAASNEGCGESRPEGDHIGEDDYVEEEEEEAEWAVETAQRAFKAALTRFPKRSSANSGRGVFKRTDKINYEFGGYDLAFASFELI